MSRDREVAQVGSQQVPTLWLNWLIDANNSGMDYQPGMQQQQLTASEICRSLDLAQVPASVFLEMEKYGKFFHHRRRQSRSSAQWSPTPTVQLR